MAGAVARRGRKEAAEKNKRRAEKFEELVAAVVEHFHWMANIRYFYISGQGSQPTSLSPIMKIDAIASTYFPEFEKLVRQLDSASNKYEVWILDMGQKRVRNEPGYERLTGHDDVVTTYTDIRAEFLMELRNFARREFQ